MKNLVWMLIFGFTLGLVAPVSAQVIVSARVGRPWRCGPPPRAYYGYGPRYYYTPAPAVVVVPPPSVRVYPVPAYHGPRPRHFGYGRGGRRW